MGSAGGPRALPAVFADARAAPARVVVEGFHALKHALRFGARIDVALTSDPEGLAELAAALAPDLAEQLVALVEFVPREELRALGFPQLPHTGVVAIARRPAFSVAETLAGGGPVVLLEDPRHLGNVGAVVRVAAGADATGVVTTGERDPWDPAALRGAAGLHFALPVGRIVDASSLQPGARSLVALDPDGDPLIAAALPPDAVLAFGTERHGLTDALLDRADQRLRIPMRAGVSSLNLATAVAAVLFAQRLAG